MTKERREDIVNNIFSEKSSDSESDSGQQNWVRHITRSGRKSGLLSGWLDPSTGENMQPTAEPTLVAIAAVQNYYDRLQEIDNDKVKLSTEVLNAYVEYSNVGAGIGCGFEHTSRLKPTKYMAQNKNPGKPK